MVGAVRFELTTSCTRNKRASQATLRPDPGHERCRLLSAFATQITVFDADEQQFHFRRKKQAKHSPDSLENPNCLRGQNPSSIWGMRPRLAFLFALVLSSGLYAASSPPEVHMLVPGFRVEQLPVDLPNINNLRFAKDGRLFALAYDGHVYVLRDTNGDGLE